MDHGFLENEHSVFSSIIMALGSSSTVLLGVWKDVTENQNRTHILEKVANSLFFSLLPVSGMVNSFSTPHFLHFCCPLPKYFVYMEVSGCSDSVSEPNFHSEGVCPPLHGGYSINVNPGELEVLKYFKNIPHGCSDVISPRHSLFIQVSEGQTE